MKIAYTTTYDSRDLKSFYNWAGLGYYIASSLKNQSAEIDYLGPLEDRIHLKALCKLKRHYHQIVERKDYLRVLDPITQRDYVRQINHKMLNDRADIVFGATTIPIAYLDCHQPTVFWSDATFANLLGSYPLYKNLCQESIECGHELERRALQKCSLAIYSSSWAAQTAIDYYHADPEKVKIVPFGANLENSLTASSITEVIDARPADRCKLLFIGYDWARKGGDLVVELVRALNSAGLNTELTVVGCNPTIAPEDRAYVKTVGMISKSTTAGKETMSKLLAESHFLIMPSQAECYGIVFCEANSFATPCIATNVGGIPTIVRDDLNGKLFDLNADIDEYCKYILNLFANYSAYKELAQSAFSEYQSRLNWTVSGRAVKQMLEKIL